MSNYGKGNDSTVDISDLNLTLQNHERINTYMNKICDDTADVIANTTSIISTVEVINNNISNYLNSFINVFNAAKDSTEAITVANGKYSLSLSSNLKMPSVFIDSNGNNITKMEIKKIDIQNLLSDYSNEVVGTAGTVLVLLDEFKNSIERYNNGDIADFEEFIATNMAQYDKDIVKEVLSGADEAGLSGTFFEVMKEVLESVDNKGLKFLISACGYADDIRTGGTGTVGDGVKTITEAIIKNWLLDGDANAIIQNNAQTMLWSTTAGGVAVAIFTAAMDYFGDQGEWTDLDTVRLAGDTTSAGLSYVASNFITTAIGGFPGIAVATIVGLGTAEIFGVIKDEITRDKIVDTIYYRYDVDKNGNVTYHIYDENPYLDDVLVYEAPRNGTGKNGSYDVYLQEYNEEYNNVRYLPGGGMNAHEYNRLLYNDLDTFWGLVSDNYSISSNTVSEFYELLESSNNGDAFLESLENSENFVKLYELFDILDNSYGFNYDDYLKYKN